MRPTDIPPLRPHLPMRLAVLLAASFLALAAVAAPSAAQSSAAPQNPCADSLYQVLRGKPLNGLTEREYEYFQQRDRACADYQALNALANQPAAAPARPRAPARITTEATARNTASGGTDIFIRNTSSVPIVVNSIRLYDCINLMTTCGTHYPKVRIAPREQRRVFTIRRGMDGAETSYRYQYSVAPAEQ